jgi:hypothetical protein
MYPSVKLESSLAAASFTNNILHLSGQLSVFSLEALKIVHLNALILCNLALRERKTASVRELTVRMTRDHGQ